MIIEIQHIKNNKFTVKVNDEEKYLVGKSWLNKNLISNGTYIITTKDDKLLYFSKEANIKAYNFLDSNNKGRINADLIKFEDHKFTCYEKATGIIQNVSIYDNDKQIAQIIFPQHTSKIYLFLLDEYRNLDAIISFYIIHCDCFCLWDGNSDVFGRSQFGFKYTYSKDDKKYYDENWIINNFDKTKVDNIYNQISIDRQKAKEDYLKYSKKVLLFMGLGCLLLLIIAIIVIINSK